MHPNPTTRLLASLAIITVATATTTFAQQQRVEMGWTGEEGYYEHQSPSVERPLSFYTSDQRQQEFLQAVVEQCLAEPACSKFKVKVSKEEIGSVSDKTILQLLYTVEPEKNPTSITQPYWKSILIETHPGMYRELLLLRNEGEFWIDGPSNAEIVNAGATRLLVTKDKTNSRDIWCTGELWVLDNSGAMLADFSKVDAAVKKAIPRGTQDLTPTCAAVNPQTLELKSKEIRKINDTCRTCDPVGHLQVKFKFEAQQAIPVSVVFSKDAQ
jgi:hypothetical protein